MWVVPVFPKSPPRSNLLPPRFQGLTVVMGLECFVINELLYPGLSETESSAVFIAQEPSRRAEKQGKAQEAGRRQQLRALVIMTRDQHMCPVCFLGVGLLALFTQVCQLEVSVMFTNKEVKALNSYGSSGRSHRWKTTEMEFKSSSQDGLIQHSSDRLTEKTGSEPQRDLPKASP